MNPVLRREWEEKCNGEGKYPIICGTCQQETIAMRRDDEEGRWIKICCFELYSSRKDIIVYPTDPLPSGSY